MTAGPFFVTELRGGTPARRKAHKIFPTRKPRQSSATRLVFFSVFLSTASEKGKLCILVERRRRETGIISYLIEYVFPHLFILR